MLIAKENIDKSLLRKKQHKKKPLETANLSSMLLQAADLAGEEIKQRGACQIDPQNLDESRKEVGQEGLVAYLKAQALATPGSFLTLLGRVCGGEKSSLFEPVVRIELVAPMASIEAKQDKDKKHHATKYTKGRCGTD